MGNSQSSLFFWKCYLVQAMQIQTLQLQLLCTLYEITKQRLEKKNVFPYGLAKE